VDKVHAPPFGGAGRRRRGTSVQRDVLPSTHPHAQLQAVEPIQSANALFVHGPPLPSQQYPDAIESESRPRMRQLLDAHPQRALLIAQRPAIPSRATELRQPTARTQLTSKVS
jgi:hypothetical protein